MKMNDSQIKEALKRLSQSSFPDDQGAWEAVQKKLKEGNMSETKNESRTGLKLAVGLGAVLILALVILLSVPKNQALAETLRNLFSPTETVALPETDVPVYIIYTVREGDVLAGIAQAFGVSEDEIIAANPGFNANALVVGDQLFIPSAEACAESWDSILYTVQAGDSLNMIASKFGINKDDLVAANRRSDPFMLEIGEQLIIPNVLACSVEGAAMAKGDWFTETDFGNMVFSVGSSIPERTRFNAIRYQFVDWTCRGLTLTTSIVDGTGYVLDNQNKLMVSTPLSRDGMLAITLQGNYDPQQQTFSGTWKIVLADTTCSGTWKATPLE